MIYIKNLRNVSLKEFREYYKMYYYYKLEAFAKFDMNVFLYQTVDFNSFMQMHKVKIGSEIIICPETFTLNDNNN